MKIKPLQSFPDFLPTTNKRYLLGSYRVKSFDEKTREYVLELDETYSPKELRIPEEMQMVPVPKGSQLELQYRAQFNQLSQLQAIGSHQLKAIEQMNAANLAHNQAALNSQNAYQQAAMQQAAAQQYPHDPEQIRAEIERLQKELNDRKESALYASLKNPDHLVSISRTYDGTKFFYESQS